MVTTFLGCVIAATTVQAQTATLKMRFVFDGAPPAAKHLDIAPAFKEVVRPIRDETLIVDPTSKGIRNVVVYVYTGRGGSKLPPIPFIAKRHTLEMLNGRFNPHIVIAQAGDTLKLIERDSNIHSPNISFLVNSPRSMLQRPGEPQLIPLQQPEPTAVPIHCNIYPWMRAYLFVLDHPFAACSDPDGNVSIPELPANKRIMFRVFHEAGSIGRVVISGVETNWAKGRFDVDLVAGMNDLGEIFVPSLSLLSEE